MSGILLTSAAKSRDEAVNSEENCWEYSQCTCTGYGCNDYDGNEYRRQGDHGGSTLSRLVHGASTLVPQQGRPSDARSFARFSSRFSRSSSAVNLGNALAEQGRLEEAETAFRAALDSSDDEARGVVAVDLGNLHFHRGRLSEAVAAYGIVAGGDDDASGLRGF